MNSDPVKNPLDEKATLMTQEGLQKLKDELEYLQTQGRKRVAERLKEAISYGDLSENSEYEEAKNEQALIEGRILEVEDMIKYAKVIRGKKGNSVQLGSTVKLKNLETEEFEVYTIVGSTESDPLAGKISNESPVGRSLIDLEEKEKIEVKTPTGVAKYQIMKIS